MATRKKTKTKAKKAKKAKKKTSARKQVARKPTRKKGATKKKAAAKKRVKTKAGAARKKAVAARPVPTTPASAAPAAGERIGVITHYYTHLSVAIVQLETGSLRVGELVRIKGHTSDFTQPVESIEVDHVHVNEVAAGQSFGLRVKEHAREHDVVYRLAQ